MGQGVEKGWGRGWRRGGEGWRSGAGGGEGVG